VTRKTRRSEIELSWEGAMAASKRKSALLWISALLLLMVGTASAFADDYPSRPIKIVVPFAAGGGNDLLTRLIGQELSASLHQPVIIENRPGAGTQIGAEAVAHTAPDGYTLLSTSLTTYALNPNLYKKLPYDPARDFAPVALTGRFELLLVANPSFPAASLADLLALARAKPNAISFASSGPASPHQMAMELLLHRAGVEMVHIAYKGAAPAVQDVIAGHVPIMMLDVATGREPIKSGLLKALASASPARFPDFPELPTIAELGFPGYEASAWQGIVAPAKTPAAIIDKLNAQIGAALAKPAMQQKLRTAGIEPLTSSPASFAEYMRSETAKWREVIQSAKISLD